MALKISNMKTIAIYCVNYHSYDSLGKYLESIDVAAEKAKETHQKEDELDEQVAEEI